MLINRLTSVFYASVLLLMINCHNIVKVAVEPREAGRKFIFNKRTDALKADVNLFFTIPRP